MTEKEIKAYTTFAIATFGLLVAAQRFYKSAQQLPR